MFLSEEIARTLSLLVGDLLTVQAMSGGGINQCYQVKTDRGKYFLKTNSAELFPDLFLCETEGLKQIRETKTVAVPRVVAHGQAGPQIFLLLDWIDRINDDSDSYLMGRQLAKMHRCSSGKYGFDHHNYIGSLRQHNDWRSTWYEFFLLNRIEPQVQIAYDNHLINNKIKIEFNRVLTKLQSVFPE